MTKNYKHDPDQMSSSSTTIEDLISQYNDILAQIQKLINEIDGSPAWKDQAIKLAFNNTSNGYMKIHNNRALNLSFNNTKLKEKARVIAEFDQKFGRL